MTTAAMRRAGVAFAACSGETDLAVAAKSGGTGVSGGIDTLSPAIGLVTLVGTERDGAVASSPAVIALAHAFDALAVAVAVLRAGLVSARRAAPSFEADAGRVDALAVATAVVGAGAL